MKLVVRFLVIAASVWLVAAYVPGVLVREGVSSYFVIAAIFAVVNALVKPVLKLLSFPLLLLTLGLFLLVINAALLGLTAAITDRLTIDGLGTAVIGGLILAVAGWIADQLLDR